MRLSEIIHTKKEEGNNKKKLGLVLLIVLFFQYEHYPGREI